MNHLDFRVGVRVRRISGNYRRMVVGDTAVITSISALTERSDGWGDDNSIDCDYRVLGFEDYGPGHSSYAFEFAGPPIRKGFGKFIKELEERA